MALTVKHPPGWVPPAPQPVVPRVPTRDLSTEKDLPQWPDPVGPSPGLTVEPGTPGSWMATGGTLWIDRGYPVIHWVTAITVGNHVMYKAEDKTNGGYPPLLGKKLRKAGWTSGRHLWKHCIPVPGTPNMYWVPSWYTQQYLKEVQTVWDHISREVISACSRNRYLGLRESYRRYTLIPWIRTTLAAHYPEHHILVSMGYPENREDFIDELANACMRNYPTPQQFVDACWTSRPWSLAGHDPATTAGIPRDYSLWTPERSRVMAMAAADKNYWQVLRTYDRLRKWLTVNPRTGKYDGIVPVATLRHLVASTRRLAAWEGPGADAGYTQAVELLASDMTRAPAALRSPLPDNELRRYFLDRLLVLQAYYTAPAYIADKKAWWISGDPGVAPTTVITHT